MSTPTRSAADRGTIGGSNGETATAPLATTEGSR